jgi:hypothetical protein
VHGRLRCLDDSRIIPSRYTGLILLVKVLRINEVREITSRNIEVVILEGADGACCAAEVKARHRIHTHSLPLEVQRERAISSRSDALLEELLVHNGTTTSPSKAGAHGVTSRAYPILVEGEATMAVLQHNLRRAASGHHLPSGTTSREEGRGDCLHSRTRSLGSKLGKRANQAWGKGWAKGERRDGGDGESKTPANAPDNTSQRYKVSSTEYVNR